MEIKYNENDIVRDERGVKQIIIKCPGCRKARRVYLHNLKRMKTKKCRSCFYKQKNKVHGKTGTRLDAFYWSMYQKCYDVRYQSYRLYGGAGIKMCDEWHNDIKKFFSWAEKQPNWNETDRSLSLARKDEKKDFSPENCEFIHNETSLKKHRTKIRRQQLRAERHDKELAERKKILDEH